MKPAARVAREARPPPPGSRLCWALRALLLLLLLRPDQVASTGDQCCDQDTHYNVTINSKNCCLVPTDPSPETTSLSPVNVTGKENNDVTAAPNSTDHGQEDADRTTLAPQQTEPSPVSDLHSCCENATEALLSWRSEQDTLSFRMLLERGGSNQALCPNLPHLVPGRTYCVTVCPPDSNASLCTQGDQGATASSSASDSPSTAVRLLGLRPGSEYNASVYPLGANGTEGPRRSTVFWTEALNVSHLTAVDIHATKLTLTWELSPNASFPATSYQVRVIGETGTRSLSVTDTRAVTTGLNSSSCYNITVQPVSGGSGLGPPAFLQQCTAPLPVSDLRAVNVSITEVTLAWNSKDADEFKVIVRENGSIITQKNTTEQRIVIGDLLPGYLYLFEVIPQGPGGTEGQPEAVSRRTENSAVSDVRVAAFTNTTMLLQWQSTDPGAQYSYRLLVQSDRGTAKSEVTHNRTFFLEHLSPGTLYTITVRPELKHVPGNASSISHYTRPSPVCDIEVTANTTGVALTWQNRDAAAPTYCYSVRLEKDEVGQAQVAVMGICDTHAAFGRLAPGSGYTVSILALVNATIPSEQPGVRPFCTDPAPVTLLSCEAVPQQPMLLLRWACPDGASQGFALEVSSGAWSNATTLDGCASGNDSEPRRMDVTRLNFSTSYNISIATLSCSKSAPPSQRSCLTGITDPPRPKISPNITSFSHNSLKVKFSGFEASHGPIQAYALVLTTGRAENASACDLKYTYEDFKKGASDTYVTYLLTVEEQRHPHGLPEASRYEVDVGNESMTRGYYNGKLEPLGSYRACVAGFTNITYKSHDRLIDGLESYVSFSPCSDAVFLPQDPGVICGAVFGCIFGALVIVAVGGFIFWRKKRKDAKNSDVSFSQIKPKKSKVIRVENFEAYFKKQQADSNCGFAEEYEDLKLIGVSQPKFAAELAENRGKNRYNNVLPYDISRVKLSVQTHSTDDYINANYMPGYHSKRDFIATQGPLPNTLKDFWRMVWEKNIYAIIMLTKCVEQGRTKCEEYWPSKKAQDYGDITVANTAEIVLPEWTIRDFTVKNSQTSESHPLRQFHFTSWPDHGVPDTTELLISFRFLVRDYMKQIPPESPVLVHCSAGVGRTGTFIAIDRLIYQMENESTVDVYGIVYDLRMHRPLMVQTEDQYVFLNQCVLDIIRSQKDSRVDLIYQNTTAMTIYENLAPGTTFGKTNGYVA